MNRLVFGCTIYNEGGEQLRWFLGNLRRAYPSMPVFVISDGHDDPSYSHVCNDFGADYIAGNCLKRLSCGALWWDRFFRHIQAYPFEFAFKVDPDTKIIRPFRRFPPFDIFGTKEGRNIQGGIQGFSRSAVNKIIERDLCRSSRYQDVVRWTRADATQKVREYIDATGRTSTDFLLMDIARRLGLACGNWLEVDSQWKRNRPFRSDVAATHPHKNK